MTTGMTSPMLTSTSSLCGTTPADVIGAQEDHAARLAAAQAANAHAFVCELPEGYHTPIGDGGVVLTDSQQLRLRIAGLLAADPPAVVLDDPTAGLSAAGESAVKPGLRMLVRGRDVSSIGMSREVIPSVSDATAGPEIPVPDDRALPALGSLLDPRHMEVLLARSLNQGRVDVRLHSVRYKPGDNVVVQYSVLTQSGWATAVAYSRARGNLKRKRGARVNRRLARRVTDRVPGDKAASYLPEVSALVQWLPLDLRLPVLADSAYRLGARLEKARLKKGLAAVGSEPELLRYWPRRRAVLRYGPYILKLYRDRADFKQALGALRAAKRLTRVRTPAYQGALKSRSCQMTVQQWVPGGSPSLWPASSDAAGRVLADLHRNIGIPLPTMTATDVLAKATRQTDFVAELLPSLRAELNALVSRLAAQAPHTADMVTSHGNFYAGQLLAGPSGLVLVDVDRMCRAAPAYDLASFVAHLAFGRDGDAEVVGTALDSLLTGYGSRPSDLDWYLSACLLRRAAVPFRFQDEDWPQAATELVRLAREVLG